jgi:ABC-type iron transport system FetAB ATPase subunit
MRYRTISVDIDLDQFSTSDLIDEIVYRKVLHPEQGKLLKENEDLLEQYIKSTEIDEACLDRACEEMSRGRKREALFYFERAIPALRGICYLFDIV